MRGKTNVSSPPSNDQMLVNWYFADPINQRGQTEYTDNGYTIDMWLLNSINKTSTIKLTEEGIILENIDGKYKEYLQKKPYKQFAGKTVTISLLTGDVLETTTMTIPQEEPTEWTLIGNAMEHVRLIYYNSFLYFCITSWKIESALLKACKLELGSQQTLAHLENGKWVLNDPPPNYAEELLKCQRYANELAYPFSTSYSVIGVGTVVSSNKARIFIYLPTKMRVDPTVTTNGTFYIQEAGKSANPATSIAIASGANLANVLMLEVTTENAMTIGNGVYLQAASDGWSIFASAEL